MAEQKSKAMQDLIRRLRLRLADIDPDLNTLYERLEHSDDVLEGYIIESLYDINEAEPRRRQFRLENFPKTALLLDRAVVFALNSQAILQVRNQVSYNDAGFSTNLNDKGPMYEQMRQIRMAEYKQDLKEFKRTLVPRMRGVGSPMRWRW